MIWTTRTLTCNFCGEWIEIRGHAMSRRICEYDKPHGPHLWQQSTCQGRPATPDLHERGEASTVHETAPESLTQHHATAPDKNDHAAGQGEPAQPPMARGEAMTIRRVGKKTAGRVLDGRTHDGYPAVADA